MTQPPRRHIQPLAPPPDRFEAVLAAATRRRHRRSLHMLVVVAVFVAGLTGGMSLDGGVATVPQAIIEMASGGQPAAGSTGTSTSASVTPEVTKEATPDRKRKRAATSSALAAPVQASPASPTPRGTLAVRGRAVSADGDPVAGLYVYTGERSGPAFMPQPQPVGVTGADGRFSLPCPGAPVLLTSWPLNAPAGATAAAAVWAAAFVGGATDPAGAANAPCSRKDRFTDVVVQQGATLSGTISVPLACDTGRAVQIRLAGADQLRVEVAGLRDGDSFRIGGLPPGRHLLTARGATTPVVVGGGDSLTQDVTVTCGGTEPSPTPEPTPTPTTTTTPTPDPSTPSPTPTSSESSTATPTSSPSAAGG